MDVEIDVDQLYNDLIDHFGTSPFQFKLGAVADIESMYEHENWQGLADLAQREDFDMKQYIA